MKHRINVGDTFYVVSGYNGRPRRVEYTAIRILSEDDRLFYARKGTVNKRSGRFRYSELRATQELYTYEELQQRAWVEANRQKVVWKIDYVKDYDTLIQLAGLIDYEIKPVELNIKGILGGV